MDTLQISNALTHVASFRGVYPSDLLPKTITHGTYVINYDKHTEQGSHWVAVHFFKTFPRGFYFDSYGLYPLLNSIQQFIKLHTITWDYNRRQLQGPTTDTCGHYACLFALFMDKGYSPTDFVTQFTWHPDVQVKQLFDHHLGPLCNTKGGQACRPLLKGM